MVSFMVRNSSLLFLNAVIQNMPFAVCIGVKFRDFVGFVDVLKFSNSRFTDIFFTVC